MALKNMCLAVNGGTLGDYAEESTRNDNFSDTPTWYATYNWGEGQDPAPPNAGTTVTYSITFPNSSIQKVSTGYWGNNNEGNTNATGKIYLLINEDWTELTGDTVYSGRLNGYTGEKTETGSWSNVTGIKAVVAVTGTLGLQRIACSELQAFSNKGGFAQIIG